MKTKILTLLRNSQDYVSGQEICEKLSVSRTAVWKVINHLKEEGYCFEAIQNKGYKIISAPDLLTESEIKSRLKTEWAGQEISCQNETQSTNVDCKSLAEQGAKHGQLCIADTQNAGRGRRGRTWESPKGTSISMSLLLRPIIKPNQASMLTIVMALAMVKALKELYKDDFRIKWPNDILFHNKKICGILTEMSAEMDYVHYVVIGCGINVNQEVLPDELSEVATSIKIERGKSSQRAELVAEILFCFEELYQAFNKNENLSFLMDEYNSQLINKNQQVKVLDPNGEFEGEALGINSVGELMVKTQEGTVVNVYAGEVSVRGIYGYV